MRITAILMGLIFYFLTVQAQDYQTGIGLRAGFQQGLSVKNFVGDRSAFEGILSTRWRGFQVTGLFELHRTFPDVDRLNWYYGFGAHVGFWNGEYPSWGEPGTSYTIVGIDGILGMEYTFEEVPVNLSLDWKPAFNIIGYQGFWGDAGAFSVRYVF